MRRGLERKRHYLEPCRELFDDLKILAPARRFLGAVEQLPEGDRRNAESLGELIKPLPQGGVTVLDHIDADVRIEHVLQHQSGSRSSADGCSRSLMKSSETRGTLTKNSSQRRPTGVINRLLPSLMTSTWCTPSGKATAFGSRTAWLRLLIKTVERAIRNLRISNWDIHTIAEWLFKGRSLAGLTPAPGFCAP